MFNEKTSSEKFKVFMTFAFIPLVAFIAVVIIPFIFGIYLTFTDYSGASLNVNFVQFNNYVEAFTDPEFWLSMWRTVKFVLIVLVLTNVLAMILALLVTSGFKGQNFFRAGFFAPNLIGGVILGFVWQFIFSRVLPYLGETLGIDLFMNSWLGKPGSAMWALVIVTVWQYAGYMMLIYIAGLASVPQDILEASRVDGASAVQTFFKIKLPMLAPSITIALFLTLQKSFMTFDTNLSLTKGGPYRQTELVTMHIYNEAFKYQKYGSGQAKAILFFIIVASIAIIQVALSKKQEARLYE